jgi:hypothetical protein
MVYVFNCMLEKEQGYCSINKPIERAGGAVRDVLLKLTEQRRDVRGET